MFKNSKRNSFTLLKVRKFSRFTSPVNFFFRHFRESVKDRNLVCMSNEVDITICLGSSCFSRGNRHTLELIKSYLKEHKKEDKVFFHGDLCDGLCEYGPILKINGKVFKHVSSDNVFEILNNYFSDENESE
jgi:hypothetical protein